MFSCAEIFCKNIWNSFIRNKKQTRKRYFLAIFMNQKSYRKTVDADLMSKQKSLKTSFVFKSFYNNVLFYLKKNIFQFLSFETNCKNYYKNITSFVIDFLYTGNSLYTVK